MPAHVTKRPTIGYLPFALVSECIEKSVSMRLGHPIPVLRIFDEAKANEFYLDFLGFKLDWEHRLEAGLPRYMQISKNGLTSSPLTLDSGSDSKGSVLFLIVLPS